MSYVSILFTASLLAGCTIIPPSVHVASPVPVIAVETPVPVHDHAYHCPPGQAKKGRC